MIKNLRIGFEIEGIHIAIARRINEIRENPVRTCTGKRMQYVVCEFHRVRVPEHDHAPALAGMELVASAAGQQRVDQLIQRRRLGRAFNFACRRRSQREIEQLVRARTVRWSQTG